MGTPDFAVASLDALLQAGYQIVGVITAPDKPAGRGMKFTESAVKKYAVSKGLNLLQPVKLKDPVFLATLQELRADLQVVVAFRMLPELVWNMPPMGTINVHASLLPQYRGAAPINWAIIQGETKTGVTTFLLKHAIDTGNILLQKTVEIGAEETAGELHDRMKETGAQLLVTTLKQLEAGSLQEKEQNSLSGESWKHAPKLFTSHCIINWEQSVGVIHNLIRGLSPHPGAQTLLDQKIVKIYRSKKETTPHTDPFGSIHTDGKTYLKFACADGYILIEELQLEGKKRMWIADFLRGYRAVN